MYLKSYLKPEFNIESDADEIIERPDAIVGNEINPPIKAKKLLKWVYENVDKKPVVSVPSALEVLENMGGRL